MVEITKAVPMTVHKFEFTGKGSEYFGIWIVNLFLSIVTAGIYTAWAKVRRVRYFYGNTHLDGHNFEYHARPIQILKGRLIVVAALIVYQLVGTFFPLGILFVLVPYLFALPWIINKSMQFNARVTSYRNVRFNFSGSYGRALLVFVVMPLLIFIVPGLFAGLVFLFGVPGPVPAAISGIVLLLTLVVLIPLISKMTAQYIGNNLQYGSAQFAVNPGYMPFMLNFLMTLLIAVLIGGLFGAIGYALGPIFAGSQLFDLLELGNDGFLDRDVVGAIFMSVMGAYLSLFLVIPFYAAGSRNIAFCAASLDNNHKLQSSLNRFAYVWILVSNLVLSLVTLSLFRPWAAIRTWRYLTSNTAMESQTSLDGIVDQQASEGNVTSAEFLDVGGIDFGL